MNEDELQALVRPLDDDELEHAPSGVGVTVVRERMRLRSFRATELNPRAEDRFPRLDALRPLPLADQPVEVIELAASYLDGDVPDDLCERLELPGGSSYKRAASVLRKRRGHR